jgi:predicted RecA/RadA family phage recombinase
MKNFIQDGKTLTLTAPYARESGEGAKVGFLFGVAAQKVANAAEGEFQTEGVFDIKKEATTITFSVGDKVYWDDSAKQCTSVNTSNLLIGRAVKAALAADTTVRVKLGPSMLVG